MGFFPTGIPVTLSWPLEGMDILEKSLPEPLSFTFSPISITLVLIFDAINVSILNLLGWLRKSTAIICSFRALSRIPSGFWGKNSLRILRDKFPHDLVFPLCFPVSPYGIQLSWVPAWPQSNQCAHTESFSYNIYFLIKLRNKKIIKEIKPTADKYVFYTYLWNAHTEICF